MDSAQKVNRQAQNKIITKVSILVIMDSAQKDSDIFTVSSIELVSILVIMDSAQKVHVVQRNPGNVGGFNPCYNG